MYSVLPISALWRSCCVQCHVMFNVMLEYKQWRNMKCTLYFLLVPAISRARFMLNVKNAIVLCKTKCTLSFPRLPLFNLLRGQFDYNLPLRPGQLSNHHHHHLSHHHDCHSYTYHRHICHRHNCNVLALPPSSCPSSRGTLPSVMGTIKEFFAQQ